MTTTTEHIDNLGNLISKVLKPGGTFIFTFLDGKRVFDLLAANNGKWTVEEDAKTKYHIEATYTNNTLTAAGQGIKIKLPFSNDLYEENLVNADCLIKKLAKFKLVCLDYKSFSTRLNQFKNLQPNNYAKLSEADKTYVELYAYVIMSY
jgi:hypothetical protein